MCFEAADEMRGKPPSCSHHSLKGKAQSSVIYELRFDKLLKEPQRSVNLNAEFLCLLAQRTIVCENERAHSLGCYDRTCIRLGKRKFCLCQRLHPTVRFLRKRIVAHPLRCEGFVSRLLQFALNCVSHEKHPTFVNQQQRFGQDASLVQTYPDACVHDAVQSMRLLAGVDSDSETRCSACSVARWRVKW